MELITIYTSNIPVDCHILKGRLESEGIDCFIFDEHVVWVHPFRAVAIGGVKLKVPGDQMIFAQQIINAINQGNLIDEHGEYQVAPVFDNEIERQNEILAIKHRIRKKPSLTDKPDSLNPVRLDQGEIKEVIGSEKEFQELSNMKLDLSWNQFLYELFDFDRSFFKYLRTRPVSYYLDKELVANYCSPVNEGTDVVCPQCKSKNVSYAYAIDHKLDVLYLILSLLIVVPFPLIRKKHHCFHCGFDFKDKKYESQ
jgi:hypothetical protein